MIFRPFVRAKDVLTPFAYLLCIIIVVIIPMLVSAQEVSHTELISQLTAYSTWEPDLIALLGERFTLLPSGIWVSGATYGDSFYGAAFYSRSTSADLHSALQIQATRFAFYDQISVFQPSAGLSSTLERDLFFFELSSELTYEVQRMEEVLHITSHPPGCLIRMRHDEAQYHQNTTVDLEKFSQYVYMQALFQAAQGDYREGLRRLEWLLDSGELTSRDEVVLRKAEFLLQLGELELALITIIPFLDYSDADFFRIFSPAQIISILTIFERAGLEDLGTEIAALAMVLYPDYPEFEDILYRIIVKEEVVHP